jgi:hypothetical protein
MGDARRPFFGDDRGAMTDRPKDAPPEQRLNTDLVEYLVVVVPDVAALSSVAAALADLVAAGTVRILDVVVLERTDDGEVQVREPGSVESMSALDTVEAELGIVVLSDRDIELASLALPPGMSGVVVVTEDRWAAALSEAARQAGGEIVAGDRIPPGRIEALLAERSDDDQAGA